MLTMTSAKVAPVRVAARRNPDTRVIVDPAHQTAGSALLRTTTTLQNIDSAEEISNAIRADFWTQDVADCFCPFCHAEAGSVSFT